MIKLNLGCGWRDFGPEWVHIDAGNYAHLNSKDIINLPYADNSVDLIYASHVFGYFIENSDAENVFQFAVNSGVCIDTGTLA